MNLSQLLTDPKSTKSKIASAKGSKQIHIIFSDIDFMTIEGIFAEMHGEGSILDMQKWAGKAKICFLKIKYCKRSKGILDTLYKSMILGCPIVGNKVQSFFCAREIIINSKKYIYIYV